MTVIGVDPNDGTVKPLTPQKWRGEIHRVVWMNDGSGLIALGQAEFQVVGGTQLWFISFPDGAVRQITNDLNNYGRVSLGLAADNGTVVTAQSEPFFQIFTAELERVSDAKQISNGKVDGVTGLTWTPDGRIVYVTNVGDKTELWIMNADGSNNRQLTNDGYAKKSPAVSPDGRFIFFDSLRDGLPHIWRINIDGSNTKQITSGDFGDFDPACAPDGQWIAFVSFRAGAPHLWKVGVDGGEPVQLTNKVSGIPQFSPDGKSLGCRYFTDDATAPWKIAIIPIAGGEPTKFIDSPRVRGLGGSGWAWAPDSRAIIRPASQSGVSNLWRVPLDGSKASPITNFTAETIPAFSLTSDGKRIALSRGHSTIDVVLIKDAKSQ
jgi:Tol biopolymer transport system component